MEMNEADILAGRAKSGVLHTEVDPNELVHRVFQKNSSLDYYESGRILDFQIIFSHLSKSASQAISKDAEIVFVLTVYISNETLQLSRRHTICFVQIF
jgi:hypothetical protein